MATPLFTVTENFEVEKELERVWQVFSNFDNWSEWTKFGVGSLSTKFRNSWIGGQSGQGGRISIEWHGLKISECVATQWDPPRRFFICSSSPKGEPDFFEVSLSLTPVGKFQTRVEFSTTMTVPSLGLIDFLVPVRWLVKSKIDAITRRGIEML